MMRKREVDAVMGGGQGRAAVKGKRREVHLEVADAEPAEQVRGAAEEVVGADLGAPPPRRSRFSEVSGGELVSRYGKLARGRECGLGCPAAPAFSEVSGGQRYRRSLPE